MRSSSLPSAIGLAIMLSAGPAPAQQPDASPRPEQASPAPSPTPPPASPAPVVSPPASPAPPAARKSWWRRYGANDKRRTMRTFPANIGYNMLGVVTPGNHLNLGRAALLGAVALPYDEDVVDYFERHPYRDFGRAGQVLGGGLVVGAATLGFLSVGRIAPWERFRASTYDISQAVLVNMLYVFALKTTVRRERPNGSDRLSFPSGHASNAFAAATVIERHFGWKLGVPGYAVASFIAVSRLAAEKHHLSDITFGAAFGFGVGRTVVRRNSRPPTPPGGPTPPSVPPKEEKKADLLLAPDPGPAGDGAGLRLTIAF